LRPGGKLFVEYQRNDPLALHDSTTVETWPIIVEGEQLNISLDDGSGAVAYRDPEAANARLNAPLLHRLSALLSLAWGEAWQVRTAPTMASRLPAAVPQSWPSPHRFDRPKPGLPPDPQPLPARVAAAWDQVEFDPHLEAAMSAWHQGIFLTSEFPSFALVAFGGCIEEVSRSVPLAPEIGVLPEACSECGNIPAAARRFREAVHLVADEAELDQLVREWKVYNKRSRIAHGSALHGIEQIYGSMFHWRYEPPTLTRGARYAVDEADEEQVFTLKILPTTGNIAARLLYRALGAPMS
jgi:hypothetical protein